MKLLIATDRDFWKADIGSRKRIARLCTYLGETSLDVYLFLTFGGSAYSPEEINAIRQQFGFKSIHLYVPEKSYRLLTPLKNCIKKLIKSSTGPNSEARDEEPNLSDFKNNQIKAQFDQLVEQVSPDFILVEYIRLSYLIDAMPQRIKTILDTHDVMHLRYEAFKKAGKHHWLKISKEEELATLNRFDAVLAIQRREQEYFRDNLGLNTTVLNVGMDSDIQLLPESERNVLRIGFIGGNSQPNSQGIISFIDKVWSKLVQTVNSDIKLQIAGSICDALSTVNLDPKIEIIGRVDEVKSFYQDCAIVINPVMFGGGLKIKSVEALAFGKPLISTPVGIMGLEDGANKAFLVAENADDFFDHLVKLVVSSSARRELAEKAFTYAQNHFSAKNVYKELSDYLELQ